MCGITGFFTPPGFQAAESELTLLMMCDRLTHRGPDNAGTWLDAAAGIALGHRRLSILDLSPAGHQPMVSVSGRYVVVYNGEIYNYRELKKELENEEFKKQKIEFGNNRQINSCGQKTVSVRPSLWRGTSDTEVLLAGIERWGLEGVLKKCVGMFALALWDRKERELSLARDRMGEKPLYYGWQDGVLLFGSELKALRAHPAFSSVIDRDAMPSYLRHGYIPAPWCVWRGIRKLLPGTWVAFRAQDQNNEVQPRPFWSFHEVAMAGQANPFNGSDQEAINSLDATLKQTISGQMVADVPLGAFLSGGIDSSAVVALMQAQSTRRVRTFTIGFAEAGYNEAVHAKSVAKHLGTDHTEFYVTADQAHEVIKRLPQIYDEPFGDSSAVPTFLVSQLARQHVTVSLSGDGGDELFGGYDRYLKVATTWEIVKRSPSVLRKMGHFFLSANFTKCIEKHILGLPIVARTSLLAELLKSESFHDYYQTFISHRNPVSAGMPKTELQYGLSTQQQEKIVQPIDQMMAQDSVNYLPNDILVKIDRASMAVSLENRVPLLDHRVVEFAWHMPCHLKVRQGQGKWLLRQLLYRYIPQKLIDRPKMGFGVPVDQWLRGPLREWGEALLDKHRLEQHGLVDAKIVRDRWKEHQCGRSNWSDSLWSLLMWQAWHQNT